MAIFTMAVAFTGRFVIEIPLQVVDHYEIEQPIIIHVHPGCGDGPEWAVLGVRLVQTGFGGYVAEGSVPVVVIERVPINPGDKNVFVAVIVVVADRYADVEACSRETRLFCHVREVSMPVIFEKAVVVLRGVFAKRAQIRPVGEENVELAVVVVVEQGDASGHGFWRMALGRFIAVELEIDRLISELNWALAGSCGRCRGPRRILLVLRPGVGALSASG